MVSFEQTLYFFCFTVAILQIKLASSIEKTAIKIIGLFPNDHWYVYAIAKKNDILYRKAAKIVLLTVLIN